jgi:hypothetical protein
MTSIYILAPFNIDGVCDPKIERAVLQQALPADILASPEHCKSWHHDPVVRSSGKVKLIFAAPALRLRQPRVYLAVGEKIRRYLDLSVSCQARIPRNTTSCLC